MVPYFSHQPNGNRYDLYEKNEYKKYIYIFSHYIFVSGVFFTNPTQPAKPPPPKKKRWGYAFKVLISAAKESTESLAVKGGFAEEKNCRRSSRLVNRELLGCPAGT